MQNNWMNKRVASPTMINTHSVFANKHEKTIWTWVKAVKGNCKEGVPQPFRELFRSFKTQMKDLKTYQDPQAKAVQKLACCVAFRQALVAKIRESYLEAAAFYQQNPNLRPYIYLKEQLQPLHMSAQMNILPKHEEGVKIDIFNQTLLFREDDQTVDSRRNSGGDQKEYLFFDAAYFEKEEETISETTQRKSFYGLEQPPRDELYGIFPNIQYNHLEVGTVLRAVSVETMTEFLQTYARYLTESLQDKIAEIKGRGFSEVLTKWLDEGLSRLKVTDSAFVAFRNQALQTIASLEEGRTNTAATTIQTAFRRHDAQQRYQNTLDGVTKIQAHIRGYLQRCSVAPVDVPEVSRSVHPSQSEDPRKQVIQELKETLQKKGPVDSYPPVPPQALSQVSEFSLLPDETLL